MNFKHLVFYLIFMVFSCSNDIQDFNQLQNRDGIYFQINTDEAFSGKTETRYPNGNLELEGTIEKGYKEGVWTTYYESSQKKSKGKYLTSLKEGTWQYWQENGKELATENYTKGVLLNENSVEQSKEMVEISNPKRAVNSINSETIIKEKQTNDVKENSIKMSQLNSSIKKGKVRKMFNGEPYTGAVKDYDENGVKTVSGFYENGLRSGKWTYYYPSGDVKDVKFY